MKYWFSFCSALLLLSAHNVAAGERVLRISTDGAYPPFSETNANGEMVGFDIDITKALCEAMKVKCNLVQIEWDALIPALKTKKTDALIASMNATDERRKSINFSEPYYMNPGRFVCRKDDNDAVEGKTLGVLRATVFDIYATKELKDKIKIKRYSAQTDAFLDLRANRIDLLFADSLVVENGFLDRPEGKDYRLCGEAVTDPAYFGEGISIGVRLNDKALADEFSAAIKAIRESGEYQRISQQYFGRDVYVIE